MWMLRGKRNRWGPRLSSRAVDDLRVDEDGLSLYKITDKGDAHLIAAAHVLVFTEESRHEWIVLPDSCVAVFDVQADPDASLPPPLRGRHHLVKGLDKSKALRLASLGCEHNDLFSFRQNVMEIRALATDLIKKYNLKIKDYWREKLALPT
jgi:hypothetical protein